MMIIPTLGVVLLICFGLSKCQSDDSADAMLRLEGVTPGNSLEAKEYARQYLSLGLDKPLFYWSLRPSFCHPNINAIVDKTTRQQLSFFQHQKVKYSDALAYIHARDSIVRLDTTGVLRPLLFLTKLDEISDLLSKEKTTQSLAPLLDKMQSNQAFFYYPILQWNGSQNQFHRYTSSLFHGEMGISIVDGRDVGAKIMDGLKWTMLLTFLGLVCAVLISVVAGSISAYKSGGTFDRVSNIVWLILYSIPSFWLASILILYCTSDRYGMHIFPTPGNWMIDPQKPFLTQVIGSAHMMVLPIITMIANDIAFLSRITRNNIIDQNKKLYATIAKARGLKPQKILTSYLIPNSMIPVTTNLIGAIPASISGSLIIEIIFNIPGVGRLMFDAIGHSDWNVVFGVVLIISTVTMLSLTFADIIYRWLNPKMDVDA
jgi:peptide/nickel transport system permease protein